MLAQVSLNSKGEIPNELFNSTSAKFDAKKQASLDSSINEPRAIRLSRLQFYEQSYYLIDAIKNNANIYVNDSYTELLNKIADELLKNDPDLRKNIHLYAYRAPYVNAFSTDQGDLFFTVGLLAHVKSEAELAFVVGHEIIHYLKQHNLEGFNERIKIARGDNEYKDLSIDQGLEELHSFSRNLEKEADLLALDYYLQTDYDKQAVIGALEMLRTAHLGWKESAFDYGLVLNSFKMPNALLPENLEIAKAKKENEVPEEEEEENEDATHPEISERINYCTARLAEGDKGGTKLYVFSTKTDFSTLQLLARKEQLFLLSDRQFYAKAIYNASLLYAENPTDRAWLKPFMEFCFVAAVEEKSKNVANEERSRNEYSGELSRVHHLLYGLKPYQSASLLFLNTYNTYLAEKTTQTKELTETTLTYLIADLSRDWNTFKKADFDTSDIRTKKLDYLLPELKTVFTSSEFTTDFDLDAIEKVALAKKKSGFKSDNVDDVKIDLSKVVIVNPYYLRIDETVEDYVDFKASYENEVKLLAAIKDAAEHNGIAVDMLDVRELAQEDADKFDDIATLTGYIRRFANRDLEANTSVFPSSPEKIEELRKKYDTDYVMWVGARSFKGTTFNFGSHLFVNLLFPNYIPYSLLNALEKDHEISLFYVLIDLKNQKIVKQDIMDAYYMKDNQTILTTYLNVLFKNIQ